MSAVFFLIPTGDVFAVENGTGIYLLGSRGPYAGFVPAQGVYWQNDLYHYRGTTGGEKRFPTGGKVVSNLESDAWINLFGVSWVTGEQALGGRLVLGAIVPVGHVEVDAAVRLDPVMFEPQELNVDDDVSTVGDPLVSASLAWDKGNFHWSTTALLNVPVGNYQSGEIANVAANRWALDVSAAMSWVAMTTGTEVSVVPGYTLNGENSETNYESGDEFHLEWSVSQALSERFTLGVIGYFYKQVNGDSGEGAVLGEYEGRVNAIGGTLSYSFGDLNNPLMIRLKGYKEHDAENRLEGEAFFLTMSSQF